MHLRAGFAAWAAFGWAVCVSAGLLVAPAYSNGAGLLAVNSGLVVARALAIPVLLCVWPLLTRRWAGVAAALLAAYVFVAGASVGLLYIPSLVALAVAMIQRQSDVEPEVRPG